MVIKIIRNKFLQKKNIFVQLFFFRRKLADLLMILKLDVMQRSTQFLFGKKLIKNLPKINLKMISHYKTISIDKKYFFVDLIF